MSLKYTKNDEGLYVCPHCNVTKKNQNTMHYHMKKHEDTMPFTCKACKKGFIQKQALDLHISSRHPDLAKKESLQIECPCPFDGCDFKAVTKGNCRTHCIRIHFKDEVDEILEKADNQYNCLECNKTFNSATAFYYHAIDCIELDHADPRIPLVQDIIVHS